MFQLKFKFINRVLDFFLIHTMTFLISPVLLYVICYNYVQLLIFRSAICYNIYYNELSLLTASTSSTFISETRLELL
jgi:hypothetical protein